MSQQSRPRPMRMTICDLCDHEIASDGSDHDNRASLQHGFRRQTAETRALWLRWPRGSWLRTASWEARSAPENQEREWDFHVDCIARLVSDNVGIYADQKGA